MSHRPSHHQTPSTYAPHPDDPLPTYYLDARPGGLPVTTAEDELIAAAMADFPHLDANEIEVIENPDGTLTAAFYLSVTAPPGAEPDELMELLADDYPGITPDQITEIRDQDGNPLPLPTPPQTTIPAPGIAAA